MSFDIAAGRDQTVLAITEYEREKLVLRGLITLPPIPAIDPGILKRRVRNAKRMAQWRKANPELAAERNRKYVREHKLRRKLAK